MSSPVPTTRGNWRKLLSPIPTGLLFLSLFPAVALVLISECVRLKIISSSANWPDAAIQIASLGILLIPIVLGITIPLQTKMPRLIAPMLLISAATFTLNLCILGIYVALVRANWSR